MPPQREKSPHKEPKTCPLRKDTQPGPTASLGQDTGLSAVAHLDVRVLGARGHELAVRVEVQAADVGFVSHECAEN